MNVVNEKVGVNRMSLKINGLKVGIRRILG